MNRETKWKMIDNLKRKLFLKHELKKIILRSIIKNDLLPRTYKYFALYNKSKLIRRGAISQQRNKCIKTGRMWYLVKSTQYSRFIFRTESYKGHLPGFSRASW